MSLRKRAKFWYSEKQSHALDIEVLRKTLSPEAFEAYMILKDRYKDEPDTQAFVILEINGEPVEMMYTEMYTGDDPNYTSNWDDAVLLADTDNYSIRVQVLSEY